MLSTQASAAKNSAATKKPRTKRRERDPVDPTLIITTGRRIRKPAHSVDTGPSVAKPMKSKRKKGQLDTIMEEDEEIASSESESEEGQDQVPQEGQNALRTDGTWMQDNSIDLTDTQLDLDSSESDLECVSGVSKVRKKDTKKVPAKSAESDPLKDLKQVICFEIPSKESSGAITTNKIKVPVSKTFEEVRTIIHSEVGCEGIKEKHFPLILLHFSKDLKKKLRPFKIERHWEDVKAEWELEVKSKKQAARIEVQIPEKWLKELAAANKLHAARSKATGSRDVPANLKTGTSAGRTGKGAMHAQVIDFYISDGEEAETEAGSSFYNPEVAAKQAALLSELENCNKCNANKDPQDRIPCRINKNGVHKKISHDMMAAWVLAMVNNEPGVTTQSPPKRDPFMEFHYFIPGAACAPNLGLPDAPLLKKHQKRRELSVDAEEFEHPARSQSVPPQFCFMPFSKKAIKAMFDDSSSSPEQRSKRARAEPTSESSTEEIEYPMVADWLKMLKEVKGAQQQDFFYFNTRFEQEKCLLLSIDTLLELSESFWGPETGLKFSVGEIAFLRKNLQISVKKIKGSTRKAKKTRH